MSVIADPPGITRNTDPGGDLSDRFIVLGEVLMVHRGHYCAPSGTPQEEPGTVESCRVVRQRDIRQFHLTGPERWVEYPEIQRAFSEARTAGRRAHTAPFREEVV